MTTIDWRELCHEMVEALVSTGEASAGSFVDLIARARAALAQPEPEVVGPTDAQLIEKAIAVGLAFQPQDEVGEVFLPFDAEEPLDDELIAFARAVLASWGRPAPAPAEVAELARWLRENANSAANVDHHEPAALLNRAADLLERQAAPVPAEGEVADYADFVAWLVSEMPAGTVISDPLWWAPRIARRAADLLEQRQAAPVPVPVSERLPGAEDCAINPRTGQGQWCWGWVQHDPPPYSGRWRMMRREWLADEAVAWLPATALPLPAGEAQP